MGEGKEAASGGRGQQRGAGVGFLMGHLHTLRLCWAPCETQGRPHRQPHLQGPCRSAGRTDPFPHPNTVMESRGTLITPNPIWPLHQCHWSSRSWVASGFQGESGPETGCVGEKCRGKASQMDKGLERVPKVAGCRFQVLSREAWRDQHGPQGPHGGQEWHSSTPSIISYPGIFHESLVGQGAPSS